MKGLRILATSLILSIISASAFAVTTLTMDLARQEEGSKRKEPVRVGDEFQIIVVNVLPRVLYTYQVDISRETLAPLDIKQFPGAQPGAETCETLRQTLATRLKESKTEIEVREAVVKARADAVSCNQVQRDALEVDISGSTTIRLGRVYRLRSSEKLTLTISRGTGDEEKSWTLEASTGSPGEWRFLYGFNWVPNQDERYFLRPRTDSKFDVVRENDDHDLSFVPSIFATWTPATHHVTGRTFGLVAGLGFDADPVGFAGLSWLFRENVSFNIGGIVHKQKRLNRRLDPAVPVAENLGDDQLHSEGYQANVFAGMAFRFSESPFKKKEPEEPAEGEEK